MLRSLRQGAAGIALLALLASGAGGCLLLDPGPEPDPEVDVGDGGPVDLGYAILTAECRQDWAAAACSTLSLAARHLGAPFRLVGKAQIVRLDDDRFRMTMTTLEPTGHLPIAQRSLEWTLEAKGWENLHGPGWVNVDPVPGLVRARLPADPPFPALVATVTLREETDEQGEAIHMIEATVDTEDPIDPPGDPDAPPS